MDISGKEILSVRRVWLEAPQNLPRELPVFLDEIYVFLLATGFLSSGLAVSVEEVSHA